MNVTYKIQRGQQPTPEQIEEIKRAESLKPVFDDAPALTKEQMLRYRDAALKRKNKNSVTILLSDADYETAKAFGTEYRSVLSDLLAAAIHDPNILNNVLIR